MAKMDEPDFIASDHGSIWLLTPKTEAADSWVAEHLPADTTKWRNSWVVEHRFVWDVLSGIQKDLLAVDIRHPTGIRRT